METNTQIQIVYPLEKYIIAKDVAIQIHNAIHNPIEPQHGDITITKEDGTPSWHNITIAPNGCREFIYNGIRFIEQNKNKASFYAKLANEGHKITWGIRSNKWIYILDGKIID